MQRTPALNNQKPEPASKGDGSTLNLHSMFFTIQGEGPFAGHRSIFVRLAGCNLQCPGCDTEYTEGRREVDIESLADEVMALTTANGITDRDRFLIVITGGEPLRQPIGKFVYRLLLLGYHVQIESNGVFPPDEHLDTILNYEWYAPCLHLVISPKTTRVNASTAERATCFKYVISHDSINPNDGLPIKALEHPASTGVARPPKGKPVYINPYDAKDERLNQLNLQAAAASAMKHGYICGVQLHKLIGVE